MVKFHVLVPTLRQIDYPGLGTQKSQKLAIYLQMLKILKINDNFCPRQTDFVGDYEVAVTRSLSSVCRLEPYIFRTRIQNFM